jgi:hypothetical protein
VSATTPGFFGRLRLHATLGARQALQWRLLLLWLVALALPVLLASVPLWLALASVLDRSLMGTQLLRDLDPTVLFDVIGLLRPAGATPVSLLGPALVFLLLLPWLSGLAMTAARTPQPPGFGALFQGALAEYPRMARLWLWALLPLGLAAGITSAVMHAVDEKVLQLTLESDAQWLRRGGLAFGALLLLLAHATVDAARAQLVIEPRRRSVVLAWWRASKTLFRRPGNIVLYLLLSAAGVLLAALLGLLRVQVEPVSLLSFIAALLLGQLLVLVLAWMRCARLFALVAAGRR